MKKYAVYIAAIGFFITTAYAEEDKGLPEIPAQASEGQRIVLEAARDSILHQKAALNAMIERFNQTCAEVEENSPEMQRCIGEQNVIQQKKDALQRKTRQFEYDVAQIAKGPAPKPVTAQDQDISRLGGVVANLVMDAIQRNGHDLDKADLDMRERLKENPGSQDQRDAASYILGMAIGNNIVGNPVPFVGWEQRQIEQGGMLGSLSVLGYEVASRSSPFPVSPRERADLQKWEENRNSVFLKALTDHDGDFTAAREDLEQQAKSSPDDKALRSALRIAQGAEVYQDDIHESQNEKGQ